MLLSARPGSTLTSSRKGHQGAALGCRATDAEGQQVFGGGAEGLRQADHDLDILLLARQVQQIHRGAADGQLQGLGDGVVADAVEGGLFLVEQEPGFGLVGLDIPVGVHDAFGMVEDVNNLAGEREAAFLVRAVDFSHEGLEDGRTGRDFGDGDAGAVFGGDGGDARADTFGNVVALGFALAPGHEVDLQIRDMGAAAHEVMAHQAVEVERGGDAGVNLVIGHLRLDADGGGNFAGGLGGAFEGAAFGHVEDDLELALVVEGQHLHLDPAEADGGHRGEQQKDDS